MEYNILKDNITITIIIIMCIIFVSTIYIVFGIFVNYELDEYMYDDKHKYFQSLN